MTKKLIVLYLCPEGTMFEFMKTLSENQVEAIIALAKVLPDNKLTAILNELQNEQPFVYQLIYGEPSDAIALLNRDMANLYLDLSFDVVWVFRKGFGKPPIIKDSEEWVIKKIALLDAELKSLTNEIPMNEKFRSNLQKRFIKRSLDSSVQLGLLQYLENQVKRYAFFNHKREKAIQFTTNLLFVLVRLFGDLYALKQTKKS